MSTRADSQGWLKDGNLAFYGGCDGSIPPSELQRNQVASAVNCTMRGGGISPRPGWIKRTLTFSSAAVGTAFKSARFQHGSFYSSVQSPSLISSHGGRLFHTDLHRFSVQEITPYKSNGTTLDRNSPYLEKGWSVQADEYWIYQDNQSYPLIFNGSGMRRANPSQFEIPIGNVMAYSQGRLAVSLPDRRRYCIGDLLFGPSGSSDKGYKDSILKFTENNYLNEGGNFIARVFGAPTTDGPITAMRAVAMTDTALGQGPLLVGTPYGVFTVNLPFDRTTWKDLQNPLQTNSPLLGPLSQDSTVLVNGDVWYRALDGIRSFIMAVREYQGWGNTPMSAEIADHLSYDTQSLLEHSSAVLFDNRLLMTTSPAPSDWGVFHRSLAVMDFNLVSGLRTREIPAWEGIWTGARVLQITKGLVDSKERCFAWVLSDAYEIELWELVPGLKEDQNTTAVTWSFELPAYNFGNSDQFKRLETGRIIATDIFGAFSGTVTYRTDLNPCYTAWDTFTFCAKHEDCTTSNFTCTGPTTYREQSRVPIRLKMPPDTFDAISGNKVRTAYCFQPKFALSGYAKIQQFRVYAKDQPEALGINHSDPP